MCPEAPRGPSGGDPPVPVSVPVEREVTDHADFTARVAAVDSVEVRAHVWGYLERVNFKEGALVKKGDVLFELDPRPYEALLNQAKGRVAQDAANYRLHDADYQRYVKLPPGTTTQSEFDKAAALREVDVANIAADKAIVASAELNLQYTKVTAPISGRVSRYQVTVGNLIQSGDQGGGTLLTTIVSVDPVYAYFDMDELTVQRVNQMKSQGEDSAADETHVSVSLALATENGFPHQGTINFSDNQVNPKTGTLRVRGVFANKEGRLAPGYFARIRMPIGSPHAALLVSDRTLDNDQGQKVLYVVNDKNEVVSRPVRTGGLHDGLREITDGLKSGDRVIVKGLQQVRPGMIVSPTVVDMPVVKRADAKSLKTEEQIAEIRRK